MIKTDSRKINDGDTFIAIDNGYKYIDDAIKNGASEIIAEYGNYEVKTTIVKNTREYLTKYLKDQFYPKIKNLKLIGITGTNGKTTSAFLIYQALNKLNIKCAYIGTIGYYVDNIKKKLNNTTPDILDIYEMLLDALNKNCKYVVMEVSSHALDIGRVDGLEFDYVFFTNLTEDHLDYHKTMKDYALAKKKLFNMCRGYKIVNVDDDYKNYFLDNDSITYGFRDSDYKITNYELDGNCNIFEVNGDRYESTLLGKYNVYNVTLVIILLSLLKIKNKREIINILVAPPGRLQIEKYNDNKIIIDYAHTPDALEKILKTACEFKHNKIYTIIGCGGDRDRTKRPIMASIATSLSDYVIFTSDNPRTENPLNILNDMLNGLKNENYEIVVDREKAINKGVQKLSKNDILMVLGKGHEDYQIIGTKKIFFDDLDIVKKYTRR